MRWAAAEAKQDEASLVVVMAWHYPAAAYVPMIAGAGESISAMQAATQAALADIITQELGPLPDVLIEQIVPCESTSQALIDQMASETLLVIGRRGRSLMREILLGSTSRSTMRHASCPIVVVPGG